MFELIYFFLTDLVEAAVVRAMAAVDFILLSLEISATYSDVQNFLKITKCTRALFFLMQRPCILITPNSWREWIALNANTIQEHK